MILDQRISGRHKLPCVVMLAILNSACTSFPQKSDYVDCDLNAFSITSEAAISQNKLITEEICITDEFTNRKYADALVISGGASDGAFGAGFISELVDQKKMAVLGSDYPRPCIITGVSTGAMMSPFVYLATSSNQAISNKYTNLLKNLYSDLDDNELLAPKLGIFRLARLPFRKSLYSTDSIKRKFSEKINNDLIHDLVSEYQTTKRKIYIGVVNVSTGHYEVIDLTRLFENVVTAGKSSQRQCVTEAIRASTSIPVVFEPVGIKDNQAYKLYVDGGLRYPFFLHKQMIEALKKVGAQEGKPDKSVRAYVVINHLGLTEQFSKNDDFYSLGIKEYISNNTEIARNQLYLDASKTLYQITKNENVTSYWVDAQSDEQCEKPKDKYFHIAYQECLRKQGEEKASKETPWGSELSLKPALLNRR